MEKIHANKTIFSFFGPPGSGKGTLAQNLVKRNNFRMLSTGNLCREHVMNGTVLGRILEGYLKKGQLIPDELIVSMVTDWLDYQAEEGSSIILDGFPRTEGQAKDFLKYLQKDAALNFGVVFVDLPEEDIVQRLSRRLVCSNKQCQASYTQTSGLTHCSNCNSLLVKRDDDHESVVRERLKAYPVYRDELMRFYASNNQNVAVLNAHGLTPERVYDRFCELSGMKALGD